MHKYLYLLFAVICTPNLLFAKAPGNSGFYTWEGTIGENIPIFVWLSVHDSIMIGEITYKKKGSTIRLRGKNPGTVLEDFREMFYGPAIYEFEPGGRITGMLIGRIGADSLVGKWWSTIRKKEYTLALHMKDTVLTSIDTSLVPEQIGGRYDFVMGNVGDEGHLNIRSVHGSKIVFDLVMVTANPVGHTAFLEKQTAIVDQDHFTVHYDSNCIFTVWFCKDIAYIQYEKNKSECDFAGMGVEFDRIYLHRSRSRGGKNKNTKQ
ncbi:MAG: hypothetical protein Q8916_10880 [Bacteroidota bacterium]|nr:hypothetical protein [Bacteroidota bacterium]MDP4230894.1 hypothetical protein [Bacteroidota bacterium]MDP4237055.1 hypothetical protein [Bacteroidota bacterium]